MSWRERLHLVNAAVITGLGAVLGWRGAALRSIPLLLMSAAFLGYGIFRFAAFRRVRP